MTIHWGLKTRNNRSVQETEQYLCHFLPLIHRNVQLSWARSQQPPRDASTCSGIKDTCAEAICRVYMSLIVYTVTMSDVYESMSDLNVSSRAAGFNLVLSVYVFLTPKAVGPIDCHYMTDRLQRFELKIFVCVLLKKQSHLHLGCPGGKQINIKFSFLGELSL